MEARIDTVTREVHIGEEPNSKEFKSALEEVIRDLMEVHAPVDLNKCCHH